MSEYIKKEDLFERTINRNSIWNTITDSSGWGLEEIVNDLPTYSFPDSAENKDFDGMTNGEVIQAVFPYVKAEDTSSGRLIETDLDEYYVLLRRNWWNAPYQKGGE